MLCEACEKEFERNELQPFTHSQGQSYLCCEICFLQNMVAHYRSALETANARGAGMEAELNLFKTCGLRPETIMNMKEPASIYYVRRRLAGLEKMDLEHLMMWLETLEMYVKGISEHIGKSSSREQIKKALAEKTKEAIKEHKSLTEADLVKQANAKIRAQKALEPKEPRVKLSDFDKAVNTYMKTLKLTKEQAEAALIGMGLTRE